MSEKWETAMPQTETEWVRLGRPDSARDLSPQDRRRLPASAFLDGARRFPVCGPDDVTRALAVLERMPPATYLAGVRRLAAICRAWHPHADRAGRHADADCRAGGHESHRRE